MKISLILYMGGHAIVPHPHKRIRIKNIEFSHFYLLKSQFGGLGREGPNPGALFPPGQMNLHAPDVISSRTGNIAQM